MLTCMLEVLVNNGKILGSKHVYIQVAMRTSANSKVILEQKVRGRDAGALQCNPFTVHSVRGLIGASLVYSDCYTRFVYRLFARDRLFGNGAGSQGMIVRQTEA